MTLWPQMGPDSGDDDLPQRERRTKAIRMRVTPSEYALIVSAAKALGVSVSEYIRGLCLADRLDHGIDRGYEGALVRYLRQNRTDENGVQS